MDYILYLALVVVAFWFGWHARGISVLAHITRDPDAMIATLEKLKAIMQDEEQGIPEDAIEVQTEQVNGLVYAYNKASGEFLAQAQSLHQVMTLAAARYPGQKFWHPELTKDTQTA
jgi:hypothetical protein